MADFIDDSDDGGGRLAVQFFVSSPPKLFGEDESSRKSTLPTKRFASMDVCKLDGHKRERPWV